MTNVAIQVPCAVSPMLTVVLFAAGNVTLPFLIGAAFLGASPAVYDGRLGQIATGISAGRSSRSPEAVA